MMMKRANIMNYNFLPETYHAINPDDGFCVPYTFIGIYGTLIKKLTLEYFTDLCFSVRDELNPMKECKEKTKEELIIVHHQQIQVIKMYLLQSEAEQKHIINDLNEKYQKLKIGLNKEQLIKINDQYSTELKVLLKDISQKIQSDKCEIWTLDDKFKILSVKD